MSLLACMPPAYCGTHSLPSNPMKRKREAEEEASVYPAPEVSTLSIQDGCVPSVVSSEHVVEEDGPSSSRPAEGNNASCSRHAVTQRIQLAQRWLFFAHHCASCNHGQQEDGSACKERRCRGGKLLLQHIHSCNNKAACNVPNCQFVSALLAHHHKCRSHSCPLCVPVRAYLERQRGVPGSSTVQEGTAKTQ
ncbi:hypothetical protein DUNSADRAFT_5180 [Dunaliella salina]|uniref:histone acetyltransferase n=1 Tax=Dunaliella salina TaxID=3046 RepID=A0ABQ7GQR1_DUNSA|nr:hypothetical protein DUNSADRAFT_5180 [Dunaliella salina]|eukprot:KAF5836951.1 hypothetical protein DUNSADRAFT_5180 [Dunaliella salina]